MKENYASVYDVKLDQIKALGGTGDKNKYDSVYQEELEMLRLLEEGGGGGEGVTPEQVRAIVEGYNYTTMAAVEAKKYMNQKKLTLNGDATAIVDEEGNVLTYTQIKALVDNKALFVYMLVDNAFYIPCGDMVVPSGHNAVEFSSAFIVNDTPNIARIIIDTENEVIYEQYILADRDWVEGQGYLTEHQSLDGYATEQWVEDKGYLTEHQPLKTINGENIVGEGNIEIQGGSGEAIDYADAFRIDAPSSDNLAIFKLNKLGTFPTYSNPYVLISYDGYTNWEPYEFGSDIVLNMWDGETRTYIHKNVYFRGNLSGSYNRYWYQFEWTEENMCQAHGDLRSLVIDSKYKNPNNSCTISLPSLFEGGWISTGPDIINCVINENGAYYMFYGSKLTAAPKIENVAINKNSCYGMFYNCTSLKNATIDQGLSMGSWTLYRSFESMFKGCTSLETVSFLFSNTSDYNRNAPFKETFRGCTNLKYIYIHNTSRKLYSESFTNWLLYASTEGTLCMDSIDENTSILPSGWTMKYALPNDIDDNHISDTNTYSSSKIDTSFAKIVSLTQAEYDALETKDDHTLYIITDAE